MSSSAKNNASGAGKKSQNQKQNVHKIKPVVVKHVMNNQIKSIYEIKNDMEQQHVQNMHHQKGAGLPTMLTGTMTDSRDQASPGMGYAPQMSFYGGKEGAEINKELLDKLRTGMNGLEHLRASGNNENDSPNVRALADANLAAMRAMHPSMNLPSHKTALAETDGINYETQSIQSHRYNQSAIGEMNDDELDQLRIKNEKRIEDIEERYFSQKDSIMTYKDRMKIKMENFTTKQVHKDSTLAYPCYGRGLEPKISMNSFMVQEKMGGQLKKKTNEGNNERSPEINQAAQQRIRIISPKRKRFENHFDTYLQTKYVVKPVEEIPEVYESKLERPDFDIHTKPEDSMNVKQAYNKLLQKQQSEVAREQGQTRTLYMIEREGMDLVAQECVVTLQGNMLESLRRVFVKNKHKVPGEEKNRDHHTEHVPKEPFLESIIDDAFFTDERLEEVVRVSVDNEAETLDALLLRVSTSHRNNHITWIEFLSFFCRRGKLRDTESLVFKTTPQAQLAFGSGGDLSDEEPNLLEKEEPEELKTKLSYDLKKKQVDKQNKVPVHGRGKYNVTVPVLYEFQKKELEEGPQKTIRSQWLDKQMQKRENEMQAHLNAQPKPTPIPKTTTQPLYEKIQKKDAQRRQKAKEASLARNRTEAKPFSFHERDQQRAREKALNACEDIDERMLAQFRARNVPWRILIPRFKMMVERDEHEREQRIIRNAEQSYKQASLPPRMQLDADRKKEKLLQELDAGIEGGVEHDPAFPFRLPRPRSVPDFRRLQKQFLQKMETLKKGKKLTDPRPFKFNPPKPQAKLYGHMDILNQAIAPTMQAKRSHSAHQVTIARDQLAEQPSTTVKFQAIIEHNRQMFEEKRAKTDQTQQEDIQRFIRHNRLQQRVNLSPALVSNAAGLKQKREDAQKRAKQSMGRLSKVFEQVKQNIQFNVANRPLLLEQVSKAFMHNLKQIKELQRYVEILTRAGMNPDEHLSAEQRELLVSAEYFDRLNLATAYFPPAGGSANQVGGGNINQQQQVQMMQGQNDQVAMYGGQNPDQLMGMIPGMNQNGQQNDLGQLQDEEGDFQDSQQQHAQHLHGQDMGDQQFVNNQEEGEMLDEEQVQRQIQQHNQQRISGVVEEEDEEDDEGMGEEDDEHEGTGHDEDDEDDEDDNQHIEVSGQEVAIEPEDEDDENDDEYDQDDRAIDDPHQRARQHQENIEGDDQRHSSGVRGNRQQVDERDDNSYGQEGLEDDHDLEHDHDMHGHHQMHRGLDNEEEPSDQEGKDDSPGYGQESPQESGDDGFYEISESVLRQLIMQHQRQLNGEDPGEPICDEHGNPIQLTQEEFEAALAQLQHQAAQQQ